MTQPRIQPNVPSEAVPEPQLAALRSLDFVEESLDRASAALHNPSIADLQACTLELESIVERLKELRSLAGAAGTWRGSEMQKRLGALQKRALVVQAMLRQGAAFYREAEQSQAGSVLGYTPRGLEHARWEGDRCLL